MNRAEEFYRVRKGDLRRSTIDKSIEEWVNTHKKDFSGKFEATSRQDQNPLLSKGHNDSAKLEVSEEMKGQNSEEIDFDSTEHKKKRKTINFDSGMAFSNQNQEELTQKEDIFGEIPALIRKNTKESDALNSKFEVEHE